jgi:CMP-N-acetylneuraminic acid synthetase
MPSPKRIAIIPARGGSKRIVNKNMHLINGAPIISYILNSAIKSNLFSAIVVSSDSEIILNHVSKFTTVIPSKRSQVLSSDTATIYEVLKSEIESQSKEGKVYEEVWMLAATACLFDANDLIDAAAKFSNTLTAEGLLAVVKYDVPPQWALQINDQNKLMAMGFDSTQSRSQDLIQLYHDAGCLAIFRGKTFQTYETKVPNDFFEPYIVQRFKGIDIDTYEDLFLVEALMNSNFIKNLPT